MVVAEEPQAEQAARAARLALVPVSTLAARVALPVLLLAQVAVVGEPQGRLSELAGQVVLLLPLGQEAVVAAALAGPGRTAGLGRRSTAATVVLITGLVPVALAQLRLLRQELPGPLARAVVVVLVAVPLRHLLVALVVRVPLVTNMAL